MIDALIAGRLHGPPKIRTSQSGKRFATCTVRTATRDGAALFVNVIAFHAGAITALLALSDGDSVAISGELTPKVYIPQEGEPRPSLDLLAHAVLTEYHVERNRRAIVAGQLPEEAA